MSKVTYIGHSGFSVELERAILLFDYTEGRLPAFTPDKEMYVFASHAHGDHFSFEIFSLREERKNVTYVLSSDIRRAHNARDFARRGVPEEVFAQIRFLKPREQAQIGALRVETLRSTDAGVAFVVEAEGASIYHGGDLNDWVWEGEPEEENAAMTAAYRAEVERAADRRFDLAFLPLDPRQEGDFWRGLDWFMRRTRTEKAYPMHFWGDWQVFDRLRAMECSAPYRNRLAAVEEYGR